MDPGWMVRCAGLVGPLDAHHGGVTLRWRWMVCGLSHGQAAARVTGTHARSLVTDGGVRGIVSLDASGPQRRCARKDMAWVQCHGHG